MFGCFTDSVIKMQKVRENKFPWTIENCKNYYWRFVFDKSNINIILFLIMQNVRDTIEKQKKNQLYVVSCKILYSCTRIFTVQKCPFLFLNLYWITSRVRVFVSSCPKPSSGVGILLHVTTLRAHITVRSPVARFT